MGLGELQRACCVCLNINIQFHWFVLSSNSGFLLLLAYGDDLEMVEVHIYLGGA